MCSITGFVDFKKTSDDRLIKIINDTTSHRGPDGEDHKLWNKQDFQVALAHRRLSIIDLSDTGRQPMNYKDLWITFNGEVYNYAEIKSELLNLGHKFKGNSDTEVVLHAFDQWNVDCLHKFIGMFSFVIYNEKTEKLFGFRDRTGIKPFYYYSTNDIFLFGSELKSFHHHPLFDKKLNLDAVAAYMQYGNVPHPYCIFQNCYKLEPGHYFKFDLQSRSFEITKYWDVYDHYNKPKLKIDFKSAKEKTESILKSAADYRMIADVPVGAFLSGGYDSACLTALLQKDRTEKIKTYTIAVPDIGLNEAPYAAAVAKHLGTDHHEIDCTPTEAFEIIYNLPFHYDEPFGDSSSIPTTLVCKMARKDVTVALSADAGDEVFAGYNRYDYLMKYGKKLKSTPGIVRKSVAGIMSTVNSNRIPVLRNKYNFHNRYEKLKGLLRNPDDNNIMMSLSKQFEDEQWKRLFKNSFRELPTKYFSKDLKQEFYSPLAYMMAVDYQTYLVDDILQKVDRASMSVSLEAREPYLDHRLIEWVAQLPDEFKYNKGTKKYILKEITHKYIPKELMDRPKMGFAIPIEKWLQNELREQLIYYSEKKFIEEQGIFEFHEINKLVKTFLGGKLELGVKMWYFYMFQLWYQRWMID